MARKGKRRRKTFDSSSQARRLARAAIGMPPSQRVIAPKKHKLTKHKKREHERELGDL
jgi:hypothetical protein